MSPCKPMRLCHIIRSSGEAIRIGRERQSHQRPIAMDASTFSAVELEPEVSAAALGGRDSH
jgi:hypothetical protein